VNKQIPQLNSLLIRGLIAAALHPGLRSILVFDPTVATIKLAAENLALMLAEVDNCEVETVRLGVIETEEDLWGQYLLRGGELTWQPGLLGGESDRQLRLLVIPDLTKLNMATARACIALMESESAYLERYGRQERWQTNLCWLAGCPSRNDELGLLSPHLLDRFALRLRGESIDSLDGGIASELEIEGRVREIRQRMDDAESIDSKTALPPELSQHLQRVKQVHPRVTSASQFQVTNYFVDDENYSARRELALLRLAVVEAQREGVDRVLKSHVDTAARRIGLKKIAEVSQQRANRQELIDDELEDPTASETLSTLVDNNQQTSALKQPEAVSEQEPVSSADSQQEFPAEDVPIDSTARNNPYREDEATVQREAASLQLPFHRLRNMGRGYGEIIGVEPATRLEDISIVRTLFEAAKYQSIRAQDADNRERLILSPADLRRYRRGILPEQMLLMLVDYTALKDAKWQNALLPYLQWAYIERASVCLIKVGAQNAKQELQAERIITKKVLARSIDKALETEWGNSTPLAHGLDISLKTLRHTLQHGRNKLEQVVMVVISDGRGNVPLKASLGGELELPVKKQGIEDALDVAKQIAELKGVKAIVLNPQPKYYSDLPIQLALALGGKIEDIPLKVWEEMDD
jgi:magnesium chelatase subunit D